MLCDVHDSWFVCRWLVGVADVSKSDAGRSRGEVRGEEGLEAAED